LNLIFARNMTSLLSLIAGLLTGTAIAFLGTLTATAQNTKPSPTDLRFFTREGKPLPEEAFQPIRINASGKSETMLDPYKITAMAGHFRITFSNQTSDPAGGFNHPQFGEQRRKVIIAVFTDISALIDRPKTKADTVEILAICNFRRDGTAASATAVYGDSHAAETGILDGGVWTTLNTGKDAFKFMPPGKPTFHGIVEINAAQQFNYDFNTSQFYGVDIYSVLLHECFHMLGIATFIKPDGTSITNNKSSGYYTRFDAMLRIGNKPLIRRYNEMIASIFHIIPKLPCKHFKRRATELSLTVEI
jgi:hypothetical protein